MRAGHMLFVRFKAPRVHAQRLHALAGLALNRTLSDAEVR